VSAGAGSVTKVNGNGVTLERGQLCAVIGAALAAFAIFVYPLVVGPAGMVLGATAWARGERRGRWIVVAAIVGTVLGLLLGLLPDKFVSN
jgi:hypothetical protein